MRRDKGRGEVPSTNGNSCDAPGGAVGAQDGVASQAPERLDHAPEPDGQLATRDGRAICQSGGVHDAARQGTRRGAINERKQL
jgi:hypothetical protein